MTAGIHPVRREKSGFPHRDPPRGKGDLLPLRAARRSDAVHLDRGVRRRNWSKVPTSPPPPRPLSPPVRTPRAAPPGSSRWRPRVRGDAEAELHLVRLLLRDEYRRFSSRCRRRREDPRASVESPGVPALPLPQDPPTAWTPGRRLSLRACPGRAPAGHGSAAASARTPSASLGEAPRTVQPAAFRCPPPRIPSPPRRRPPPFDRKLTRYTPPPPPEGDGHLHPHDRTGVVDEPSRASFPAEKSARSARRVVIAATLPPGHLEESRTLPSAETVLALGFVHLFRHRPGIHPRRTISPATANASGVELP